MSGYVGQYKVGDLVRLKPEAQRYGLYRDRDDLEIFEVVVGDAAFNQAVVSVALLLPNGELEQNHWLYYLREIVRINYG